MRIENKRENHLPMVTPSYFLFPAIPRKVEESAAAVMPVPHRRNPASSAAMPGTGQRTDRGYIVRR